MDFFDFSGIVPALPGLWNGMIMTLKLMVMGVIGGVALGTVLALMRLSSSKWLSNLAGAYVNYFRSIPLLLVITWFYLAVPFVLRWITGEDTPIGAFTSCVVAFMMFEAAYFCEIVRAGVQSIPKGQMAAAQAMGMTYGQTMRLIILPQAFKNVLPALANEFITLLKETSISGYIAIPDLTKGGDIIRSQTYDAFLPLFGVAVIYLVLVMILTAGVHKLETRLRTNER